MVWLQSLLVKFAQGLLDKLAKFVWRAYVFDKEIKENNEQVDKEVSAINAVVNEVKAAGAISEEQERRLRETTRNLIHGTFNK